MIAKEQNAEKRIHLWKIFQRISFFLFGWARILLFSTSDFNLRPFRIRQTFQTYAKEDKQDYFNVTADDSGELSIYPYYMKAKVNSENSFTFGNSENFTGIGGVYNFCALNESFEKERTLVSGKWPSEENEIAVTEYFRYKFRFTGNVDGARNGEPIFLHYNGKPVKEQLKIVGIVRTESDFTKRSYSYDGRWIYENESFGFPECSFLRTDSLFERLKIISGFKQTQYAVRIRDFRQFKQLTRNKKINVELWADNNLYYLCQGILDFHSACLSILAFLFLVASFIIQRRSKSKEKPFLPYKLNALYFFASFCPMVLSVLLLNLIFMGAFGFNAFFFMFPISFLILIGFGLIDCLIDIFKNRIHRHYSLRNRKALPRSNSTENRWP